MLHKHDAGLLSHLAPPPAGCPVRRYGTSYEAVQRVQHDGKVCILDIDIQGVQKCQRRGLKAVYISLRPPSIEALASRLEGRNTETPASLKQRIIDAKGELEAAEATPFHARIVNDDLEDAYAQLKELLRPQLLECRQLAAVTQAPTNVLRPVVCASLPPSFHPVHVQASA